MCVAASSCGVGSASTFAAFGGPLGGPREGDLPEEAATFPPGGPRRFVGGVAGGLAAAGGASASPVAF